MKTIVINTLEEDVAFSKLQHLLSHLDNMEIINTAEMNIQHCVGCNRCWLKTPGICAIKDDFEIILKKIVEAGDLWFVSGTHFGFLDYKGKRILDRIVPMLNMYLEFRGKWMRHKLRYHELNIGVIYKGKADKDLLEEWSQRAAENLGGHSLGVIELGKEEAICM